MYFSEEFISTFSIVLFVGVMRPIVNLGVFFVRGISESFRCAWGVMGKSGVKSLFGVAKDKLLLKT